jgi:hypothetical protein
MVERITIQNNGEEPTLEEQVAAQEAAAKAAEQEVKLEGEVDTPERPEWLPEKFKTVEDMAAAYKELEAGKSKPKAEETEAKEGDEVVADEAIKKAGLDMEALGAEWDTDGKLSDESYKALEAVGITPDMVELYAAGLEAQRSSTEAEMLAPLGGNRETYNEMISWAADELPESEIDSFNAVLETGNTPAIKLAVAELAQKYGNANGVEPKTILSGTPASTANSTYSSTADLMKDMQNPEYTKNPSFRAKVEAKLGRSNIL